MSGFSDTKSVLDVLSRRHTTNFGRSGKMSVNDCQLGWCFDIYKEPNSFAERMTNQWVQCPKLVHHIVKIKEFSFVQHNLVIVAGVSVVSKVDESLLTRTAYGAKSEA